MPVMGQHASLLLPLYKVKLRAGKVKHPHSRPKASLETLAWDENGVSAVGAEVRQETSYSIGPPRIYQMCRERGKTVLKAGYQPKGLAFFVPLASR